MHDYMATDARKIVDALQRLFDAIEARVPSSNRSGDRGVGLPWTDPAVLDATTTARGASVKKQQELSANFRSAT